MEDKIEFKNGYFMAPNDIFDLDLKIHEKMVYLYLCRCGNNSIAFPSYNTIAKKCSISRRKAIDCVTRLKECNLLRKQYRRNKEEQQTNIYKVATNLSAYRALPSAHHAPPSEQDAPYKELVYKELNKKIYLIKDNEANVFKYYSSVYEDYFGQGHPTMNEEKMKQLVNVYDEFTTELDISEDEWMELVDYHFDSLPEGNNGNILGFLSGCIYRYVQDIKEE